MKIFDKVAIVGIGLIGGAIAMEIKKKRLCRSVVGISRHKKNLQFAKKIKAIDAGSVSLEILKDADMVILATPVSAILEQAPEIAKAIRPDCIVCDVASTKYGIVARLDKLFPRFIGTHPLAGSEKRGIKNSPGVILDGSICIITPTKRTDKNTLKIVTAFFAKIGFKTVVMSAQDHDLALSFISHLPHLAAFTMINSIPRKFLDFAPPSLRETTRIASSDPQLWTDIILNNKRSVLNALELFLKNLSAVAAFIKNNDKSSLERVFAGAQRNRKILK
ncbi:MAG: prephenate dehydrogenase [Candidatus Omnitrophica bacterium]|jgi:prephenate dehydrogenase|nr:prephenate dehydrogenase [Candidatus Omnitrophota bacterium]MDD5079166.1 prephenate dehydrogenase [Candidatus Omnitrophota bacterium]